MTTTAIENTDIIIVGGGMVGLSIALALNKSGYQVTLVESASIADDFSFPTQSRVSAITRASENWLKSLAAWQQIPQQRLSAYRQMKVWQQQGEGILEFQASDVAEADLGHIVENKVITTALKRVIKATVSDAKMTLFEKKSASNLIIDSDMVCLTLVDGRRLQGRLIIAADGSRSWVRQQLNIPVNRNSYAQQAIVALIESEKNHQKTAWQRFLTTGPLAFLPMKQKNLHSIVWTVSEDIARELMAADESEFLTQLNAAIEARFGQLKLMSPRADFPLIATHARSYTRHRTVLVGDAAHSIHPLAGQGVNLGFADAKKLVEILLAAKELKQDPGELRILRKYERQRRFENFKTQQAMSIINQSFLNQTMIFSTARNLALKVINNNHLIKKQVMLQAMGLYD